MCVMRNGRIVLPDEDHFREMALEYQQYPNRGDQRQVRPSIRAMEIGFRLKPDEAASQWCVDFWKECWRKTECIPGERSIANSKAASDQFDFDRFLGRIDEIYNALNDHFRDSRDNSNLDPRHDAAFGFAFYALYLAFESLATGAHERAIGQTIVRSIAEIALTFAYLRKLDDPKLWLAYRNYGTGQVKLNFLKLLEKNDVPDFVDMDFFERLINEDFWHEHLEINLGHWAKRDLRKLAEECGMKDVYDKYYSTTSPFVHGTWSAVRMVSFETCLSPLHRLHRIPSLPNLTFPSIALDLKKLLNIVLETLTSTYPEFKLRIRGDDFARNEQSNH